MSTTKKVEANCIAYLRDDQSAEFLSAFLELAKGQKAKNSPGSLMPRKSTRAYTAVFQLGLPERVARALLTKIAAYLRQQRFPKVGAVGIAGPKDTVEVLSVQDVRLDDAAHYEIQKLDALDAIGKLPWSVIVVFGVPRHWRDAQDDVESVIRTIQDTGLHRGNISVPWGSAAVKEKQGRGIYVELKSPPHDSYYDDLLFDDDSDEDEDTNYKDVLESWHKRVK